MERLALVIALMACNSDKKPLANPVASGSPSPELAATVLAPDDAILEAVYLHEIAAANVQPDEAICLRVRDAAGKVTDPSPALVSAVRAKHPKAAAASECSGGGGADPVRHAGARAVMFDIGPVKRDAATTVEGGGGHRGGGTIREIEYTIESSGGVYRVASERVLRQN